MLVSMGRRRDRGGTQHCGRTRQLACGGAHLPEDAAGLGAEALDGAVGHERFLRVAAARRAARVGPAAAGAAIPAAVEEGSGRRRAGPRQALQGANGAHEGAAHLRSSPNGCARARQPQCKLPVHTSRTPVATLVQAPTCDRAVPARRPRAGICKGCRDASIGGCRQAGKGGCLLGARSAAGAVQLCYGMAVGLGTRARRRYHAPPSRSTLAASSAL